MNQANDPKTAGIGSWVKIRERGMEEDEIFHLSGITNARKNQVSPNDALGRALLGARPGDTVTVQGPVRPIKFSVIDVGRE